MVTLSLVEGITSALEQDRNATRIKKLLVCACRHQWLNDRAALARLSWSELLLELYHSHASLDQLSEGLFDIVKQLNRKAEYAQVASALLNYCEPLYGDRPETTQFLAADADSTQLVSRPAADAYDRAAATLDAHAEASRLRKLVYCATYGEWHNDRDLLAAMNLADLLAALVSRYPSADYLQVALNDIVQNLNRRQQYAALAAAIVEAIAPLYESSNEREDTGLLSAERPTNTRVTSALAAEVTQAIAPAPTEVTVNQADQPTEVLPPPHPADQATEVLASRAASSDDTTNYTPANTATDFNAAPQLPAAVAASSRAYDAFSVRLEVMKYANPLRAKILAFSTLHHKFEVTGNEWSSMRTRPFDELLAQLYSTYNQVNELETQLYETAKYLDAVEDDRQAAEAIVKALTPFYRDRAPVPAALARA